MSDGAPQAAGAGALEQLVFGTREQARVDAAFDRLCRAHLGAPVAAVEFRAASVGVVAGVRLADGRRVVVKAHPPRESRAALAAIHRVQAHLHREGFPCPRPLLGPTPLANGLAVAEELVDEGAPRDTHDPACRRLMAEALAWHLELAKACGAPPALAGRWTAEAADGLWADEAHSPELDFRATAAGAEWIDALAAEARRRLGRSPRAPVVGHHDWSGKHMRFAGDRIAVIYDWDSVRLGPEALVAGIAAMTFTTNVDLPQVALAPTPDEVRSFVDDYSAARPTALTAAERAEIAAQATFVAAYVARCEHCAVGDHDAGSDPGSFTSALREHGRAYLDP